MICFLETICWVLLVTIQLIANSANKLIFVWLILIKSLVILIISRINVRDTLGPGSQSLLQMKVDAVNLAHHHIQDKGLDGIVETVEQLKKANFFCLARSNMIFLFASIRIREVLKKIKQ